MPTARSRPQHTAAGAGDLRARQRRILRFAAAALLQTWWYELTLPRLGLRRVAERTRSARTRRIARRFHGLAVDLGGLMIKVGQFMSARLDVLPPEITRELEGLQDEVPAVPFDQVAALAQTELGLPAADGYAAIDPRPIAAASLGQVHRARLAHRDAADIGVEAAVVKIQRPGIDRIVAVDLEALRTVAGWLSRVRLVTSRVDPHALVEEFAQTSLAEIDYVAEAANAERFAANFADDPRVAAPEVVWERTTRRVLTLTDVTAIKLTDVDALREAGIDPAEVAQAFASVMFDQLFDHGFFHADPHPGNVFVTPVPPGPIPLGPGARGPGPRGTVDPGGEPAGDGGAGVRWRLTFIDFGMMGEVPDRLRGGLRAVLIAAASRDGAGLVAAIRDVGVLLPTADVVELERALTQLFARFGGMSVSELRAVDPREFIEFATEFGELVRSLPVQLPENFLLIVRAMSLTSGVCSALDPAYNVWDSIEPYATRLIRDESGNLVQDLGRRATAAVSTALRLPQRLTDLVDAADGRGLVVRDPRTEQRLDRLERLGARLLAAVLFAALLLAGAVLWADQQTWGLALMLASALPGVRALVPHRRRRRPE